MFSVHVRDLLTVPVPLPCETPFKNISTVSFESVAVADTVLVASSVSTEYDLTVLSKVGSSVLEPTVSPDRLVTKNPP